MKNKNSSDPRLRRPLPANRTFEQVRNHYLVEKAIAERLKKSSREERGRIYATMYDELFSKVSDHPRLTAREDERFIAAVNKRKLAILRPYIDHTTVFAEFGPGDCKFAMDMARCVRTVYGIDVSDQRDPKDSTPENFQLIIYDGYTLDAIKDSSVDIAFSNNLIEHLHPEDTQVHFMLVHRLLKEGGKYVFQTPHAFNGPTDVSGYFTDDAEGFHLKEWTYTELRRMLKGTRYRKLLSYWTGKGIAIRVPNLHFQLSERALALLPRRYMRAVTTIVIPKILCVAVK